MNKTDKKRAIKAARELGYSMETLDKLRKAKTDNEIDRILKTARNSR